MPAEVVFDKVEVTDAGALAALIWSDSRTHRLASARFELAIRRSHSA